MSAMAIGANRQAPSQFNSANPNDHANTKDNSEPWNGSSSEGLRDIVDTKSEEPVESAVPDNATSEMPDQKDQGHKPTPKREPEPGTEPGTEQAKQPVAQGSGEIGQAHAPDNREGPSEDATEALSAGLRKSTRRRSAPQHYTDEIEYPQPRPKKKARKSKTPNDEKVSISTSTSNPMVISLKFAKSKKDAKKNAKDSKKDSKKDTKKGAKDGKKDKAKEKSKKHAPVEPPQFTAIPFSFPSDILWQRLALREFVMRFDKLCKLPMQHSSSINDPTSEWSLFLYKSVILVLVRIVFNDVYPIFQSTKEYLNEFKKTAADSPRLWVLLDWYVTHAQFAQKSPQQQQEALLNANGSTAQNDSEETAAPSSALELTPEVGANGEVTVEQLPEFPPEDAKDPVAGAGDSWEDQERQRLDLMVKLMQIAAATATIRLTIEEDQAQVKKLSSETSDEIKRIKASWEETSQKLSKTRPSGPGAALDRWQERYNTAKKYSNQQIKAAEDMLFFKQRKCNPRTSSIGKDTFGNTYWIFQQKSLDIEDLGSCIVCWKEKSITHPSGQSKGISEEDKAHQLFYVSGKQQIRKLMEWIRNQYEEKTSLPIIKDLNRFSEHVE
uniref:ARAD1B04488p n=1 Tax=Blastobotrys adeninivorans TaxID=409370 RepID=A0A060T5H4_BLAAD